VDDPEFAYLVVRDAHERVVFSQGKPPADALFGGTAYLAYAVSGNVHAWAPISLEGLRLGSVAVVFSTERFDELARWAERIAIGVTLVWLAALVYSILFARAFVAPIRAMMDFSCKVAGGT